MPPPITASPTLIVPALLAAAAGVVAAEAAGAAAGVVAAAAVVAVFGVATLRGFPRGVALVGPATEGRVRGVRATAGEGLAVSSRALEDVTSAVGVAAGFAAVFVGEEDREPAFPAGVAAGLGFAAEKEAEEAAVVEGVEGVGLGLVAEAEAGEAATGAFTTDGLADPIAGFAAATVGAGVMGLVMIVAPFGVVGFEMTTDLVAGGAAAGVGVIAGAGASPPITWHLDSNANSPCFASQVK